MRLDDVSAEGCSLRARPRFLWAGQNVVLRMSGLEGLIGEVRWVTSEAGIKFELTPHIVVVGHIARKHPQIECEMID